MEREWIKGVSGADPNDVTGAIYEDSFTGTMTIGRYYPAYDKYEVLDSNGDQDSLRPASYVLKRLAVK